MREAVIVEAVRTPVGKRDGGLSTVHAVDLSAHVLNALVERTGIDPGIVDDVVWGCVSQVGDQSSNVGRYAVLAAGQPVPSRSRSRLPVGHRRGEGGPEDDPRIGGGHPGAPLEFAQQQVKTGGVWQVCAQQVVERAGDVVGFGDGRQVAERRLEPIIGLIRAQLHVDQDPQPGVRAGVNHGEDPQHTAAQQAAQAVGGRIGAQPDGPPKVPVRDPRITLHHPDYLSVNSIHN